MELNEISGFIEEITKKSGDLIRRYFRSDIQIERKADQSPVTIADRETEQLLSREILDAFPDHRVLGEEFGLQGSKDAVYEWVLDPIDGTKSFIHGVPLFTTLIALLKNGIPLVGAIHNPVLGDLLIGDNRQCLHNRNPVKIRMCKRLEDALLLTSDHFSVGEYRQQSKFDKLAQKCRLYRTWGDAYGYFLLATGYADIMVDPIMNKWDMMALIPVVRGAGGIITNYVGEDPVEGNNIIAAPPELHSRVIEILN